MNIKKGLVLRKVGDSYMVIPVGEMSKHFHGMIKLNSTAADVWQLISEGRSGEEVATIIADKYNVSLVKALSDVAALIQQMRDNNFIED